MKPDFEKLIEKVSENNNMMAEYAENFRSEIEKNYVSRSRTHNHDSTNLFDM